MHPDRAEFKFYAMYIQENMAVIDAGAFTGQMTHFFTRLASRVHAFEPDPRSFKQLKATFELHPRGNAHLHQKALSDKVGEAKLHLFDDRHAAWSTLANRPIEPGGVDVAVERTLVVPTTTVDEYCKEQNINCVGLLKVDAEGAELPILHGARGLMEKGQVSCCVFEYGRTWWDMGYTPDEVEKYLTEQKFEIMNILHDQPVFPGREGPKQSKYAIMVAAHESMANRVKGIIQAVARWG